MRAGIITATDTRIGEQVTDILLETRFFLDGMAERWDEVERRSGDHYNRYARRQNDRIEGLLKGREIRAKALFDASRVIIGLWNRGNIEAVPFGTELTGRLTSVDSAMGELWVHTLDTPTYQAAVLNVVTATEHPQLQVDLHIG